MDKKASMAQGELIPFQETVDTRLFFPEAGRREVLDEVKQDLTDGVEVISISGEEGSGKTMLCRMLEKELSGDFSCTYVTENLESFDDVLELFAEKAGVPAGAAEGAGIGNTEAIISALKANGKRLIVIFDQAERIYLAMLERIRKLLDQANAEDTLVQLIFSGRMVLRENLEQLAICDLREIKESHFILDDLDVSETYDYLNYSARQRSRARGKCIFTPEAAKKIFSISSGNFKRINTLAAQSVESADADDTFMIKPANVAGDDGAGRGVGYSLKVLIGGSRTLLLAALVIVVLGGLVYWFLLPDDKSPEGMASKGEKEVATTPTEEKMRDGASGVQVVVQNAADADGEDGEKNQQRHGDDEAGESKAFLVSPENEGGAFVVKTVATQKTDDQNQDGKEGGIVKADKEGTAKIERTESITEETQESTTSPFADKKVVVNEPETAPRKKSDATTGTLQPNSSRQDASSEKLAEAGGKSTGGSSGQVVVSKLAVREQLDPAVINLPREQKKTVASQENEKKAEKEMSTVEEKKASPVLVGSKKSIPWQAASLEKPKKIYKIAPVKVRVAAPAAESAERSNPQKVPASESYQRRLAAGEKWLLQAGDNKRTIQLMALTAALAAENLPEKLARQEFRALAPNLHIVKNRTTSLVYVYYGEFSDSDTARRTVETLPQFLRKDEPYVISLQEARSKASLQQQ